MLDSTSSEIELLKASMKGDTVAFGAVVKKYQSLVCAITFSATANLDKSEELAHEAFIRAWTNIAQLKDLTKFRAWLCSIVRNVIRNYIRDKKRDVVGQAASLQKTTEISSLKSEPLEVVIDKEQQAVIRKALGDIPESYREPLILFYREQKSVKQVAKLLELSEDAAKMRVFRGRRLLKDQISAMVEDTVGRTGPGKAFTAGVVASIAGMAIEGSGVATAVGIGAAASTTGATVIIKTIMSGMSAKIIAAAAVVAIGVGAVVTYKRIANLEGKQDSFVTTNTPQEQEWSEVAQDVAATEQVGGASTVFNTKQRNEATIIKEDDSVAVEGEADKGADDPNVGESTISVSGVVIDKRTSRPIKGAEVFYSFSGQRHSVIADVNGHFAFLDMQPSERQYVNVIAKDYTTRRIILNIVKDKVFLDLKIELTQGAGVAGIVTDESGEPIVGAKVKTFHFTNHPVTTAEDGEYEIDGLDPAFGHYSLHVTHPNYPAIQVSFPSPAAGQTTLMDVVLKPGVTVHGKITDSEENPVADVEIGTTTSLIMWNSVKCKTDTEGMYTLENVPVGELVLWAMSDKHAPYVERFPLDGSEARKLINIQLDDPWPLRGKIVDTRGNAVPGAKVIIEEYKGVGSFFASKDQSDSGGRFVIPNAPATGKVTVHVYGEDISRISTELEMGQREYVITVHRNRKFYGKVVDDKTDAPITRFNVKLRSSKKGSNPGWGYSVTWSDEGHYFDSEQGFFETDDLQVSAEYSVTVYADGFDPLTIDPVVIPLINLGSGRTEFRLKSPTAITGRIVDSNDVPIVGARIRFLTDDNKLYHYDDRDTTFSNS
ncbi:MAG: sigma-70 family RNA polymerase sigma factor, partial [Sedimentisphaerales bacterium]